MALDRAIAKLLTQTIYVAHATAVDNYAKPTTFGTATAVKARVEPRVRESTGSDGELLVTEYDILTATEIKRSDRVWLPGVSSSDATKARAPAVISAGVDERGATTHWRVSV